MIKGRIKVSKRRLENLYVKRKLSTYDIAEHFGCSPASVQRALRKHHIKIRNTSEAKRLSIGITLSKDELRNLYVERKLTGEEIAEIFGCCKNTVYNRLREYGFGVRKKGWMRLDKKRRDKGRKTIPEEHLRKLYMERRLTIEEIAEVFNCSTTPVIERLRKYGVEPNSMVSRLRAERERQIPARELENLYFGRGLSTREIAKHFGCSQTRILGRMDECQVKPRSYAESQIRYSRKSFSGNLVEKSYLVGFRIGDLRVRKQYPNGKTIKVDCGSTKPEQIQLIKNLFENYGRVWISKPNKQGAAQIEAFLDDSFGFLLNAWNEIPGWVKGREKNFWPFLAGFTDADGCISLGQGKAYYSLGNYKRTLLGQIRAFLIASGISCPRLTLGCKKGWVDKNGYVRRGDYWVLRLTRKKDLLQLFENMGPYLKHPRKLQGMERARENIFQRNERFGYINMD